MDIDKINLGWSELDEWGIAFYRNKPKSRSKS